MHRSHSYDTAISSRMDGYLYGVWIYGCLPGRLRIQFHFACDQRCQVPTLQAHRMTPGTVVHLLSHHSFIYDLTTEYTCPMV